ncbi:hypothetical protein D3C87_89270 [compost metagenome]
MEQVKTGDQNKEEIVITRTFNAPRDLVWKTWTEPERVKTWWGPKNYTCSTAKVDLRVGGKYLFDMIAPEGKIYWSTGTYSEIDKPSRISSSDSFADDKGNIVDGTYYGMGADFPRTLYITVNFEEESQDRTKMTLRHTGFPPGEMLKMTTDGWNESLDKFENVLKKSKN